MSSIVTVILSIEIDADLDERIAFVERAEITLSDTFNEPVTVTLDDVIYSTIEAGIPGSMTSNELADTAQGWADAAGNAW